MKGVPEVVEKKWGKYRYRIPDTPKVHFWLEAYICFSLSCHVVSLDLPVEG